MCDDFDVCFSFLIKTILEPKLKLAGSKRYAFLVISGKSYGLSLKGSGVLMMEFMSLFMFRSCLNFNVSVKNSITASLLQYDNNTKSLIDIF